jgi:hypothetical protein
MTSPKTVPGYEIDGTRWPKRVGDKPVEKLAKAKLMPEWSVKVIKRDKTYKTVFQVGCQYFTICTSDDENLFEAKQYCDFIKKMFLKALAKLGIEKTTKRKKKRDGN